MKYVHLSVSYDGSNFLGYQIQKEGRTVQEELQKVISKINDTLTKVDVSGRTDRGVHANGQCVSFKLDVDIDETGLKRALNSLIKPYIYVRDVKVVDEDFHARFSVKKKRRLALLAFAKKSSMYLCTPPFF